MSDYRDPSTWRLSTPGGIPIRVISRAGDFTAEDASASEVYLIRASDLVQFADEVLPTAVEVGKTILYLGGGTQPGNVNLRADKVKYSSHIDGKPIDPYNSDPSADAGTYSEIIQVTVDYKPSKLPDEEDQNDDPTTVLEISGSGTGELLLFKGGARVLKQPVLHSSEGGGEGQAEPNKDPAFGASFIDCRVQWSLKWPKIPYPKFSGEIIQKLRAALGHVNSQPFVPLWNAPPETLLFDSWNYSESYSWRPGQGVNANPVSIDLKMLEKHIDLGDGVIAGWNDQFTLEQGWVRIGLLGEMDTSLYRLADFMNFFRP